MTAKKLEDLDVAKTNRVVVNEMEGKKRMFQCSLFLTLILSECSELAICYSHRIMSNILGHCNICALRRREVRYKEPISIVISPCFRRRSMIPILVHVSYENLASISFPKRFP